MASGAEAAGVSTSRRSVEGKDGDGGAPAAAAKMTVKSPKLSLTSGASTGMPMRLHSLTITDTVSTSPASAVKYRRHVLHRVVGLHVRGLVGHFAVARGVRLVKAVRGKGLYQLPQPLGFCECHLPYSTKPAMNFSFSASISSGIFLPMALRNLSASSQL
jgi:hypothetical protein